MPKGVYEKSNAHKKKLSIAGLGRRQHKNNAWKGENAGYVAKHIWIRKYHGKATCCENNKNHKAKRFEWANISGLYLRNRNDYKMLCPSCHRKMDFKKSDTQR